MRVEELDRAAQFRLLGTAPTVAQPTLSSAAFRFFDPDILDARRLFACGLMGHPADYDLFIRNLAIAGGLLFIVGLGPGPFALDQPGKKKK